MLVSSVLVHRLQGSKTKQLVFDLRMLRTLLLWVSYWSSVCYNQAYNHGKPPSLLCWCLLPSTVSWHSMTVLHFTVIWNQLGNTGSPTILCIHQNIRLSFYMTLYRSSTESRAFSSHSTWVFMDATNMLFLVCLPIISMIPTASKFIQSTCVYYLMYVCTLMG